MTDSTEEQKPIAPTENEEVSSESPENGDQAASDNDANEQANTDSDLVAQSPQFADLPTTKSENGSTMERFYDVSVNVSAEIGRASMTLGELLRIGEGAVVKLDRQVSAPVELVAQGVRVASGDVVVVDDCFAVRIREIEKARS